MMKILHKIRLPKFFLLFIGLVTTMTMSGQRPVVPHNIGTGNLIITSTEFGNDYIITGTTAIYTVTIQTGYQGTITLNNVTMTYTGTHSCIHILGQYNQSNLNPVTKVDLVLDGDNDIQYKGTNFCAIQVDQGAQIHISAIDPNDNTSGTLFANSSSYVKGTPFIVDPPSAYGWAQSTYAGAGIGAPIGNTAQGVTNMICEPPGSTTGCTTATAGGNIIISSGTVFAHGGHGAGIGGGYRTYYDGIIIITGGDVQSYAQAHGAGIGSGCPCGQGVDNCYAPNSTIIVLPPAHINAAGGPNRSPYHFMYETEFALAGMANITYLNDPNKTLITVFTQDTLPNANIYLDLTQMQDIVDIFDALGLGWYNLAKVRIGRTDATTGMLDFRAELQQNTTFFTDASSLNPVTFGRPYMPETRIITGNAANRDTIILLLLPTDISFIDYPSIPLEVGYTAPEAQQHAFHMKVSYHDAISLTNVSYVYQDGIDFSPLIFLASDSSTVISPPTTLTDGMEFFIIFPLDVGKPLGVYSDVLLIDGVYGGVSLPGYIRRIGQQRVVFDDSYSNDYIRVTASPDQFITPYPTTNSTTLNLNIDHTGTSVLYDYLDVVAMYLVTPIADYNLALAANPLYSSGWQQLNVPLTNNGNETTIVDFSALLSGTYYIHWYVESGVVYAHSLDVISPPALYGGFGPYIIQSPAKLFDDQAYVFECGTVLIDVLANDEFTGTPIPALAALPLPLYGTASVVGDKIQYTDISPCDDGNIDVFRYFIATDTATIQVAILPVPQPTLKDSCSFTPKLEASRQYDNATYLWEYSENGISNWMAIGTNATIPFTEAGYYRLTSTYRGLVALSEIVKVNVIKTMINGGMWYETYIGN